MECQETKCCDCCGYYFDTQEENDICYLCKTINENEYFDFINSLELERTI